MGLSQRPPLCGARTQGKLSSEDAVGADHARRMPRLAMEGLEHPGGMGQPAMGPNQRGLSLWLVDSSAD